jgi:glyoxylase-like metal-dependent hydrolase (beta-lactamase superfamily II)
METLKRQYGISSIDAVLLTHYHDDHVAGCNVLREVEGTEVWAAESFADILEHPAHYDLPCLWYDPVPVDRKLPLERKLRWEEYEFTLHELPGHTLYAVAVAFEADGKRVLAIGDQQMGDDGLEWNYVYQNRFRIGDYARSAALYGRLQPDVMVSGHWEPVWVDADYLKKAEASGRLLEQMHRELLPLEETDFGAEGFGARFYPYQAEVEAGGTVSFEVETLNPFHTETEMVIELVLPDGWKADETVRRVSAAGKGKKAASFTLTAPRMGPAKRLLIAANITAGNRAFGQQAEAFIHVRESKEVNGSEK